MSIETETKTELDVSNYRGSLYVAEGNGHYYWAVECDMDTPEFWDWEEIPKSLYDEIMKHDELRA